MGKQQDKRKKQNQNLMRIVKALHDLTVHEDLQKQRCSQENIGKLFGTKNSEATYTEFAVDTITCEWVRPIRPPDRLILFYTVMAAASTPEARNMPAQ